MLLSKDGLENYLLLLLIVKIIFIIFVILDLYSKYKLHKYLNSFKTSTKEIENKKKILKEEEKKISYIQELFHTLFTVFIGLLLVILFHSIVNKKTIKITINRHEAIYLFSFGLLSIGAGIKFGIHEFNKKIILHENN